MTSPYIPGQAYIGSKVETAPTVLSANITTQAGIRAGGLTPTLALVASNAGTGASITTATGFDQAGHFSITAGTSPTTGTMCTVVFGRPLNATPSSIQVTGADTSGVTNASYGATSWSKTGFSVVSNAAMTLNHVYLFAYQVVQ